MARTVRGPDAEWAGRIEAMLRHKGQPWLWQDTELLRRAVPLEARFFILERRGAVFANLLLSEHAGVALLGHVWTEPADRGGGASSQLMELALADFAARGGRAIFLGTEFGGTPWHYYGRRGFVPVEPGSGCMARYFQPQAEFEAGWFHSAASEIVALDWTHWPTAAPLFLSPGGGSVRLAGQRLHGRMLCEEPLLPLIRAQREAADGVRVASALATPGTAAVLGLAARSPHPLFPGAEIVDVFCHPRWWDRAGDLLDSLRPFPSRAVAFCDTGSHPRRRFLEQRGFRRQGSLPGWLPATPGSPTRGDLDVLVRH